MDDSTVLYIWFRYFHKKYRHVPILLQKVSTQKYRDTKVPSYDQNTYLHYKNKKIRQLHLRQVLNLVHKQQILHKY